MVQNYTDYFVSFSADNFKIVYTNIELIYQTSMDKMHTDLRINN